MKPIEAICYPIPPTARILAMWLAWEPGAHDIGRVVEETNLERWDVEEAIRVLTRPELRWLKSLDTDAIELKDDCPFAGLFPKTRHTKVQEMQREADG